MWKAILQAVAMAGFRAIMKKVSEEILKNLADVFENEANAKLVKLRAAALKTKNPWDDVGVEVLQGLVDGVKITPPGR